MNYLLTLGDPKSFEGKEYITRHTARAIVNDNYGNIAIMHVKKWHYHKLPGGGIEDGEDIETALRRECYEEVGVEITNIEPVGEVLEWRNGIESYNEGVYIEQISHCFRANVLGYHPQNLTEYEKLDESKIIWVSIEEALQLIENDVPINIEGEWIKKRELAFLKNI